uniref:Uncharacterized protein n=1 Tax=Brassica oleracea var. oleracea TaxID=109376 RepID=A0A0D3CIL6_BRAOL
MDSASPHSSYHTSPSPFPAPAPLAPTAAPVPAPPGPPGVMSVAELVRQSGRDHLPYLTPYPHGRGLRSSEIPDEYSEEHFVGTSEDWTIGKSIEISRGSSPSIYSEDLSDELVVLRVSSEINFLGIPSEISERFPRKNEFPRSYFRGHVLSVCSRNNVIPTTYRRFFLS